jgi:hypothetical protein
MTTHGCLRWVVQHAPTITIRHLPLGGVLFVAHAEGVTVTHFHLETDASIGLGELLVSMIGRLAVRVGVRRLACGAPAPVTPRPTPSSPA